MSFQLIDDGTGRLRKVLILSDAVNCAHPKCEGIIEAGEFVYHARLKDDVEVLQRAIDYLKAQRQRDSAVVGEEVTGQCL